VNPTQHWLFLVDDWLLEFGFDVVILYTVYMRQLDASLLECAV